MMLSTLLLLATLGSGLVAQAQEAPPVVDEASLPLPAGVLLASQAFALREARPYPSMKGQEPVTRGTLLALQVDPVLALPRQVAQPVVYVGAVPAERLNTGWPSGRLLLLVPGEPDLSVTPVFFGPPGLPERIDTEDGAAELAVAVAAGIQPFTAEVVRAARADGGEPLALRDSRALDHAIADWLEAWAPEEAEAAYNLRIPAP
jgi:hypothetical protein